MLLTNKLRTSAVYSAALVFVAVVTGSVGMAAAATTSNQLCDQQGSGLCVTAKGGLWGPDREVVGTAKSSTTAGKASQALQVVTDGLCGVGGVVTLHCPFVTGFGLDRALLARSVFELKWVDHSTCLGVNNMDQVVSRNCATGEGTVWVKLGAYAYVNRFATNQHHKEMVLTTSGVSGAQLTVAPWKVGVSQWKFE